MEEAQAKVAETIAAALHAAGDAAIDAIVAEEARVRETFQFAPFPPAGHKAA